MKRTTRCCQSSVSSGSIVQNVIIISEGGQTMTKPQTEKERNRFEKVKYETVKYLAFFAPPVAIYIVSYYFCNDFLWSAVATILIMVMAVLAIAVWYGLKSRVMD